MWVKVDWVGNGQSTQKDIGGADGRKDKPMLMLIGVRRMQEKWWNTLSISLNGNDDSS